ncbi:MAG: glycosyltransferase family 9 protein [Rhodospirillales bacterium]|nr:glycosyltransferase family 9 protein [Rhodospirillales bacterium]
MAERILVFRRGSLGDGIVSLPALHALSEHFPASDMRVLTNSPVSTKAAPLQAFLDKSGLVQGFFSFPVSGRNLSTWKKLRDEIRGWQPNRLVYLSEPSKPLALVREIAFFQWCGIRRFTGLPFGSSLRTYRKFDLDRWEPESARLLRAVGGDTSNPSWDAGFSDDELAEAREVLSGWLGKGHFISFCVGGKGEDKDWGNANWQTVLAAITARRPDLGLLAVGATDEAARADDLLGEWKGPSLNICGRTAPRITGQAMADGLFYLGHDSGPMHLAALVGIPCIAVFSARAKPGVWFPAGDGHRVFYPWEATGKISAIAGLQNGGKSVQTIKPEEVSAASLDLLEEG